MQYKLNIFLSCCLIMDEHSIFENNGSGQVQRIITFLDGVTSRVQPPTLLITLRSARVSSRVVLSCQSACMVGLVLPNTLDFDRECMSFASGGSISPKSAFS